MTYRNTAPIRSRKFLRQAALVVSAFLAASTLIASAASASPAVTGSAAPATLAVSKAGTWLVDSDGRVVVAHGVDIVHKTAPYYPDSFTSADARFLASEGFNVARIGFIWEAAEPSPGVYDDSYIQKIIDLDHTLGAAGIRSLIDVHQDLWTGMPAWATIGVGFPANFQAFWDNASAPDGIGIQTHFDKLWAHIAARLKGDVNIIGLDPLNEPQAGVLSACVPFLAPCPLFEKTELAAFYTGVIASIRSADTSHVIFVEGVPQPNLTPSTLPRFPDSQTAYSFHQYCQITQFATSSGPQDVVCQPLQKLGVSVPSNYAASIGVPAFVGEFSSGDANDDNAYIVDQMASRFMSWNIWQYYTYAQDPANTPGQGLLLDDGEPGSEANAKQSKLDAIAVPYATAIAGTPISTAFDRSSRLYQLSYKAVAVAGAILAKNTATKIFLPSRVYPSGYTVKIIGGSFTSDSTGHVLTVSASRGASSVTVEVAPR